MYRRRYRKVNVFTEFTTAALTGAQKAIAEGNLKSFMRVQELADIEVKKYSATILNY